MKTIKKIFSVVLILLILSLTGLIIDAKESEDMFCNRAGDSVGCGENLTWSYENGVLTISGEGNMIDFSDVNETPWYPYINSIVRIVIESGVKGIGSHAFSNAADLEIVDFCDTLTYSGLNAFKNCDNIKKINVPDVASWCRIKFTNVNSTPTVYTPNIYVNDEALIDVIIPEGITEISDYAFFDCYKIESVIIPNGVVNIGQSAFFSCTRLASVTIPDTLVSIKGGGFADCDSLERITLKNNVKSIESTALRSEKLTVYCYEGSYVDSYCTKFSVPVEYIPCDHKFTNYIYDDNTTCTNDGTKTAYCDNGCGMQDTVILEGSALGHIYGDWIIIDEPTYDREGYKIQNCTVCQKLLNTEKIPKLIYEGFPDVWKGSWYYDGVEFCFKRGYIIGTDRGTFEPNGVLTREQLVVILARFAGANLSEYTVSSFEDVEEGSWYSTAVNWASEIGIVKGMGNGKFGVGNPLSREQLAVILYRYAELQGLNVSEKVNLSYCSDAKRISEWALDACAWVIKAGILGSTSEKYNYFSPQMTVSRAQAAKVFISFYANSLK